jgi:hypothetical protein
MIFFKSHISEKNKLQEQIKKLSDKIEQQKTQYKSADETSQKKGIDSPEWTWKLRI